MGVAAVAVYSDADCCALRTPTADEAVRTGESALRLSYVSIDRIVQTALRAGPKAIRQAYGFLSENLNYAGLANSRTSCSSVRARRRSGQWQ
jgi:acetyl/propionyl-CoA carboxylase alpha subunit